MSIQHPLISVLICNYNYSEYIEESLISAIGQNYPNIEIIVIDDGSKDNSVQVVHRVIAKHPQATITLKVKKQNEGLCYARNDAIDLAKGEFFVFLDSDDVMSSDYISRLFNIITDKKADVVYSDVRRFGDEKGESIEPEYDAAKLLIHNYINISALVRKDSIGDHRFDVTLNRKTLEDYDFWLGLSLKGLRFVKADGVHLSYRIQSESRNKNYLPLKERLLDYIQVWTYSISKYRKLFPGVISEEVYIDQLKYQVTSLGGELASLNQVVHDELLPELEKRQLHITSQYDTIDQLELKVAQLKKTVSNIESSNDYIVGHKILNGLRRIKGLIK